jgi:hypothetical protein
VPDTRFTETCANVVYGVILSGETHWLICRKPIRPCGHAEHLTVKGQQLTMSYCGGWVHETGSARCYHPDGAYGPEGAARPWPVKAACE